MLLTQFFQDILMERPEELTPCCIACYYHLVMITEAKEVHGLIIYRFRPRENGCHFPDDIFKWIFLNENVWISIEI